MIRFSKIIISNFFFLVIACSCGFYSLSGSLPPHIRTISIPMVENETAEFGIAENISDGIQSRFNDEGILKIFNDNADSVLRVEQTHEWLNQFFGLGDRNTFDLDDLVICRRTLNQRYPAFRNTQPPCQQLD